MKNNTVRKYEHRYLLRIKLNGKYSFVENTMQCIN